MGSEGATWLYDPKRLRRISLRELQYMVDELEQNPKASDDEMAQKMLDTVRAEIDRRKGRYAQAMRHEMSMYG